MKSWNDHHIYVFSEEHFLWFLRLKFAGSKFNEQYGFCNIFGKHNYFEIISISYGCHLIRTELYYFKYKRKDQQITERHQQKTNIIRSPPLKSQFKDT